MSKISQIRLFKSLVENKYSVFNSLFLNLPFKSISNTGTMLPVLAQKGREGLAQGKSPKDILSAFFSSQADLHDEKEQIDFLFKIVQYIERQVVLFDAVEDAAFSDINSESEQLGMKDIIHLAEQKALSNELIDKLNDFSVRIVFTAHPTQFYTPAVLNIIEKLRRLVRKNDINGVDQRLQQLGLSSLMNIEKPTPLEEAKNIIYFLRHVYYDAVAELYGHIRNHAPANSFDNPNLIRLGFWPGGDRDGNPYVTAETTRRVADELRMNLMNCYYKDLTDLREKLTFKHIQERIHKLSEEIHKASIDTQSNAAYTDILNELQTVRERLISDYNALYLSDLDRLIDKVKIFKNHFATLDIRQDHSVHKQLVKEILKQNGIMLENLDELKLEKLRDILLYETFTLEPNDFKDSLLRDTVENIQQLRAIQHKNGEQGCNRYIISHSEDIFSVLFVFALFRWSGYAKEDMTFDIVPLFETMIGMQKSEAVMQSLFETPEYRAHLRRRGNRQNIMVGFSDGTKDGGFIKANWSIFEMKESLSILCEKYKIEPVFFDGRGGPPARGGGKAHRFYAAGSDKTANNEIQLTIQGQTITGRYGTKAHFKYHTEQLLTAGFSKLVLNKKNVLSDVQRALLNQLAEISYKHYTDLKNHPKFIPYLENKSTLKYYGRANIASRPAKRGKTKQLTLKDLRAISFVGSWSQLKQNVPGYFGVGTALKTLVEQGRENDLKALFREVEFFKALIFNSMMSMSKSYFALTDYIKNDPEYGAFRQILQDEFDLSKAMVLRISGFKHLIEDEPLTRQSVALRERIVLPLLLVQQYALQKAEENSEYKSEYEKIVERSLYGNINAARNSA